MVNKSNQDFKKASLEMLNNYWVPALFVALIVWFLANSANTFTSSSVEEVYRNGEIIRKTVERQSSFLGLLNFFFSGPAYFGGAAFFLNLMRRNNPEVKDVISGFSNFFKYFLADLVMFIFIVLWALLLIIPGIIAAYRYSMTWYILNDNPEMSFMDGIQRSKELMDGNKMALFSLQISFFGWFLLAILTMGIGFIPLYAYYTGAKTAFYEELIKN
ncbi:MAG: DUF975 family protein [Eubacteriales bacterium]|jgi:uncharacterized membrane protein|nr:DUF975 family protein [Eubacteriales bacterium]NCC80962.1 DUF975 family protein [Clostridia bacterium]